MIPSPWVGIVLALAAFRLCRLLGWDELPPVARARAWVLGATVRTTGSSNAHSGLTSEQPQVIVTYKRPLLAHFVGCPFCLGAWCSLVVYLAWVWLPTGTLYAAFPFALSGAVGLISKQLDP